MRTGAGRREEKRRETGERIYAEAIRLFQRNGFENVKVDMIAKAARVSVPTFYAHFPSKETMLMPLPTQEEISAVFAAQPEDRSPAVRARGAIDLWLQQVEVHARDVVLERWRIIATTPSLRLKTAEFERATAALALKVLAAENSHPIPPAVEVAINALMSAYTQVLLRWADSDGSRDLQDVAGEVFAELHEQL